MRNRVHMRHYSRGSTNRLLYSRSESRLSNKFPRNRRRQGPAVATHLPTTTPSRQTTRHARHRNAFTIIGHAEGTRTRPRPYRRATIATGTINLPNKHLPRAEIHSNSNLRQQITRRNPERASELLPKGPGKANSRNTALVTDRHSRRNYNYNNTAHTTTARRRTLTLEANYHADAPTPKRGQEQSWYDLIGDDRKPISLGTQSEEIAHRLLPTKCRHRC